MIVMPDIKVYLPDDMYYKLKKTKNRSKLVQDLLRDYWQNQKEDNHHKKKDKEKDVIESKIGRNQELKNSIGNSVTPNFTLTMVRGI